MFRAALGLGICLMTLGATTGCEGTGTPTTIKAADRPMDLRKDGGAPNIDEDGNSLPEGVKKN
jgi:hypothetical protein